MTTFAPSPVRIAALAAAGISLALASPAARAQTTVPLDGTSGSNSISTAYTLSGDTTFDLGFYVDFLVVGGGGGGGGNKGGGGGGGQVLTATNQELTATSYSLTVGTGGAAGASQGTGGDGVASSAFGVTADRGRGGLTASQAGGASGSGFAGGAGGGATTFTGGGGGGASALGSPGITNAGGTGGAGVSSTMTGTEITYGGGGGGGANSGTGGSGTDGGGNGGFGVVGVAAATNRGGGGGGGGDLRGGGRGGDGVVVVQFAGPAIAGVGGSLSSFVGDGTIGESGVTYQVSTFNASGAFNLSAVDFNSRLGVTLTSGVSGSGNLISAGPGRLTLAGANDYSGNTSITAGTLEVTDVLGNGSYAGTIANNGSLSFNSASAQTLSGVISGIGSLTKSGSGTLTLSGANAYSGGTTISAGTLIGTSASLQGDIANAAALVFNDATGGTYAGVISGAGALEKAGAGTVILSGANTFSGNTTITAGSLEVTGVLGNGAYTAAIANSGSLIFNSASDQSLSGVISGTGSLIKSNSGTLSVGATNSSFSGEITVSGGTLVAGNDAALGTGSVTLAGGGLHVSPGTSLSNPISLNAAAASTSIGGTFNVDYLVVGGGGGGAGNKGGGGGGGEALAGVAALIEPSYSVVVGSGGAAGGTTTGGSPGGTSSFGAIAVATGGQGGLSASAAGGASGNGNNGGAGTGTASYTGGGGGGAGGTGSDALSTKGGDGGVGITSSITGSSLEYAGGGGGGSSTATGGTAGFGGGAGGTSSTGGTAAAANTGGGGGGGGGTSGSSGTALAGSAGGSGIVVVRYFGSQKASGGTVTAGTGAATGYTLHTFNSVGTDLLTLTTPVTATLSGDITGTGGFTLDTPSTLVLTGTNSYGGETIISAGTLQVGNNTATGSLGSGAVTNNASLVVNRSNAIALDNSIGGTGSLVQAGTGATTLSGTNTYTGGTQINAGVLSLGSAGAIGSSGTISFGGGTLRFSASNTSDYSNRFSTAASQPISIDTNGQSVTFASALRSSGGTLTKTGAGNLILSGSNDYTGGTQINAGVLTVESTYYALSESGLISFGGGTLRFSASNTSDYSNRFSTAASQSISIDTNGQSVTFASALTSSGGTLAKTGAGNLILSGASTYTGATTVSAGRLSVNGSLGNTAVAVSGGELGGSGSIGGTVSVASGGTLAPGNSIESLAAGATSFASGAIYEYEVDSRLLASLGSAADVTVVSGDLSITSGALLSFTDLNPSPAAFVENSTIFTLFNYSGNWDGGVFTYNSQPLADGSRFAVGSQLWEIDYNSSTAGLNFTGDYLPSSSFVTVTAVPEPFTLVLGAVGIAGGAWLRRRRLKAKAA